MYYHKPKLPVDQSSNQFDVFRCTMSAVPQTQELLKKCRLPLGLTLHPFKDLKNLSIVQTNIVRCRYCRTYINPYVYLPDNRHWKCNICLRSNDLPDEFCWDPATKSYGDPTRRPELHHPTIEYIASSEYMLRPPQPALYFFILDVSSNAIENGYLHTFSEQLLINLDQLPGDDRLLIGFLAVDAMVHYFQFTDPKRPPKHLIVDDIEDIFIPTNSGFCVELAHFRESVRSFIQNIPTLFEANASTSNCVGAAIDVAHKLIAEVGGRITVFQTVLPDIGPGALKNRASSEKPDPKNLVTATDFYKRIALECTGHQVAVDLFVLSNGYVDLSTLSEISKFSAGSVYHYPNYHINRGQVQVKRFQRHFNRYLTRKIGFEAVLRIRCSRGLSLHTFHGNFFVRSTDLLAMANVNPDSAIGVQVQLEDNLAGQHTVCFQAALLYTSSKGDRRIRVHTLCLPITSDFSTIFNQFDLKASVSMLAKMASERALSNGEIADSKEGLLNAAIDALGAYNRSVGQRSGVVLAPTSGGLKMLPLYILGLLKHRAFSSSSQAQKRLDERIAAMLQFKNAPLEVIMLEVHPALYAIHNIDQFEESPQRLPLSYERVNRDGIYLLDTGNYVYLYICSGVRSEILQQLFDVSHFGQLDEDTVIEQRTNPLSDRLHNFLRTLQSQRGLFAPIIVIREDSPQRDLFTMRLIEDRTENAHSYIEFINHLNQEIQR
uniref:Protein transport protein Sec24B n=1 Tax=Acrobeloides nanus TaxID=290746 RepID=A0A914CCA1_9BILA